MFQFSFNYFNSVFNWNFRENDTSSMQLLGKKMFTLLVNPSSVRRDCSSDNSIK